MLALSAGRQLSSLVPADADDLVGLLTDGEVAGWIPTIPQPYDHDMALDWIEYRRAFRERWQPEISFAIRDADGRVIGSVSVDDYQPGTSHNAELGYWIGSAHRGKGITTEAVGVFCAYAFEQLDLARLTAYVMVHNVASVRVLERSGFEREGRLRQFLQDRYGLVDAFVFGRLADDS